MQHIEERDARRSRNPAPTPTGQKRCSEHIAEDYGRSCGAGINPRATAESVLSHAAKAIEIEDIEVRVTELEKAAEASKASRN